MAVVAGISGVWLWWVVAVGVSGGWQQWVVLVARDGCWWQLWWWFMIVDVGIGF